MTIDYKHQYYEQIKPDYKAFDEGIPEYWSMKYLDRWATILELLPADKVIDISVLDVGCGLGRACKHFNGYGAECLGVEPAEYAAGVARDRGIAVINDYFEDAEIEGEFDVIHIEQVLSHTPIVQPVLNKAYKLLKPGGVLVVEEPNDGNQLQKCLEGTYGKYWITEDHANYFNFRSMEELLEKTGFKVEVKSCTYPMEFFALMGFKYIGNETIGKMVHGLRYKLLEGMGRDARERLLRYYAKQGLGRDFVLFAKKDA